jgi:hypothetical protein
MDDKSASSSSQPLFFCFCSEVGRMASSFAFDPYDALLFHVSEWSSSLDDGKPWLGISHWKS